MITKLATPGVYVDEISTFPPSVAEVDSAIPAFIGYTSKATASLTDDLILKPTRISSLSEFVTYFGGAPQETDDTFVSIKVTETQTNAITTAYAVEVKVDATKTSSNTLYHALRLFYDNGGGSCYIVSAAKFKAPDADELVAAVKAVADYDEPTMLLCPEAVALDDAGFQKVVQAIISQCVELKDRFGVLDVKTDVAKFRNATLGFEKDRYAAAYHPYLETAYNYPFAFGDLTIDEHKVSNNGGAEADGPNKGAKLSTLLGSVLYNLVKVEFNKNRIVLPPSAAIAGVYTQVDSSRGVWKAPANVNLASVIKPVTNISDKQQENLNIDANTGKSINVIRAFPGRGVVVWGARTLEGNDNEWRYINVRRFFMVVEESIKKSIGWAVFEPNTANTWTKVKAMIENYLFQKWRDGALAGAKPEQAYFVRIGLGITMTPQDILEGKMNVEIGLAVARPAEFIILKFSHLLQQA